MADTNKSPYEQLKEAERNVKYGIPFIIFFVIAYWFAWYWCWFILDFGTVGVDETLPKTWTGWEFLGIGILLRIVIFGCGTVYAAVGTFAPISLFMDYVQLRKKYGRSINLLKEETIIETKKLIEELNRKLYSSIYNYVDDVGE